MPQNPTKITASLGNSKSPRAILPGIFAFAPNRDTLGATAYFIVNKSGNILLDCPAWNEISQEFLSAHGGVKWSIVTHRGGLGKQLPQIQEAFNCEVILQEQEAYLLPEVNVNSFGDKLLLNPKIELISTPGHSPGSSCLYWQHHGGVLFSGRHLLPTSAEAISPLRTAKTFHWWRQLNSVAKLRDRFSPETLKYIIPGANTGYLRGKGYIDRAYERLVALDLDSLRNSEIY